MVVKLTAGRKVARRNYNTRKAKTTRREKQSRKLGRKQIVVNAGKLKRGLLTGGKRTAIDKKLKWGFKGGVYFRNI